MNGLDSTLEALAFNPINLSPLLSSLFNNIWALVAIFTATAMISLRHLRKLSPPNTTLSMSEKVVDNIVLRDEVVGEREVISNGNNKSNNKFFNVYYDDVNEGLCVDDEVYEEDDVVVEEGGDDVEVVKKWTVEMTGGCGGGVVGWYEFQDRRVINGSVVRLWEGNNSPRGGRGRRNIVSLVSVSKVENVGCW